MSPGLVRVRWLCVSHPWGSATCNPGMRLKMRRVYELFINSARIQITWLAVHCVCGRMPSEESILYTTGLQFSSHNTFRTVLEPWTSLYHINHSFPSDFLVTTHWLSFVDYFLPWRMMLRPPENSASHVTLLLPDIYFKLGSYYSMNGSGHSGKEDVNN